MGPKRSAPIRHFAFSEPRDPEHDLRPKQSRDGRHRSRDRGCGGRAACAAARCLPRRRLQLRGQGRFFADLCQRQHHPAFRLCRAGLSRRPRFLAGPCPSRRPCAGRGGDERPLRRRAARVRIPLPAQGRHLWLGERRADPRAGCRGRAARGGGLVERHRPSQSGRGGRGARAGTAQRPARKRSVRDLQLQGARRLRADLRQREYQAPARLLPGKISRVAGFLARAGASRRSRFRRGRAGEAVRDRQARKRVPLSQAERHLYLGKRRAVSHARRGRRAGRDRRFVEQHHRAKRGRAGLERRARAFRPSPPRRAGGGLQLRGRRVIPTHFRQRQHQARARLRTGSILAGPGVLALKRSRRGPRRGRGGAGEAVETGSAAPSSRSISASASTRASSRSAISAAKTAWITRSSDGR